MGVECGTYASKGNDLQIPQYVHRRSCLLFMAPIDLTPRDKDDLFAWTIKMPTLHRLATLRDDV